MEDKLTVRRKRLLFRSAHRGIKEMDIILGKYTQENIASFELKQLDELEYLLSFDDRELLSCFVGESEVPPQLHMPLFYDILSFSKRLK